jgi:ketosteroid isomerase-like protein
VEDEAEVIAQTYLDYFEAFQKLDPDAILPYYDMPCMILSSDALLAVAGIDQARDLFAGMMKGLAARSYGRSEWTRLGLKQLGASAAVLSAVVIRYRTDGAELERFGATYTMRKTDAGWKIVMLTVHDAGGVLDLPPAPSR